MINRFSVHIPTFLLTMTYIVMKKQLDLGMFSETLTQKKIYDQNICG